VNDAIENSNLNNIKNINFIEGDVNDTLSNYLKNLNEDTSGIVAIVNPPRNGLDKNIINIILNSKIQKLIYVSCNYISLLNDVKYLSRPNFSQYFGNGCDFKHFIPFKPIFASSFDLFPQTFHFEMFLIFERIDI
jgi:23S rRNA (uracil1939-C5)-methyltransferase